MQGEAVDGLEKVRPVFLGEAVHRIGRGLTDLVGTKQRDRGGVVVRREVTWVLLQVAKRQSPEDVVRASLVERVERHAKSGVMEGIGLGALAEEYVYVELREPPVHWVQRRPTREHVGDQRQHAQGIGHAVERVPRTSVVDDVEDADSLYDLTNERQVCDRAVFEVNVVEGVPSSV